MNQNSFLQQSLAELQLALSDKTQQQLLHYVEFLQQWNRAFNLTAVRDLHDIITHHLLDSLSIAAHIEGSRILDVGTGAGLPGVPLALTFPDRQFFLLDSNGKKIRFLIQIKSELALSNVEIVQARLETYQPAACLDTITTRAFSSINDMISQCWRLLCPNGQLLLMKGKYPTEELSNVQQAAEVISLQVPGLAAARHLVKIRRSS